MASSPGETRAVEVLRKFRRIFHAVKRHSAWAQERCGLGGAQLWSLEEIAAHPGLTVGELAAATAVHMSTASNLVRGLEARGLVRRERRAEDHRVVRIRITAAGHAVLRHAPVPARGVLQQALLDMPAPVVEQLGRQLDATLAWMMRPGEGEAAAEDRSKRDDTASLIA